MFRNGLLLSTAMTSVALLLSGAPAATQAQTAMHIAAPDTNARFLCTYRGFQVSSGWFSSSAWIWNTTARVAVPVKGHGQTVSRIKVVEARYRGDAKTYFTAGIYSNGPSGFPGNRIAVGRGNVGQVCGPVSISIPPTTLKPKTTYWIEETAVSGGGSDPAVTGSGGNDPALYQWQVEPKAKRKAYVQTYHNSCSSRGFCSSSTSPWQLQRRGPYLRLK